MLGVERAFHKKYFYEPTSSDEPRNPDYTSASTSPAPLRRSIRNSEQPDRRRSPTDYISQHGRQNSRKPAPANDQRRMRCTSQARDDHRQPDSRRSHSDTSRRTNQPSRLAKERIPGYGRPVHFLTDQQNPHGSNLLAAQSLLYLSHRLTTFYTEGG